MKKHNELFFVEKLFRVYESILTLEENMGKFIPLEELENYIKADKKIKPKVKE